MNSTCLNNLKKWDPLLGKYTHSDWLWVLIHKIQESNRVKFAEFCIEQVMHIYEKYYPRDDRFYRIAQELHENPTSMVIYKACWTALICTKVIRRLIDRNAEKQIQSKIINWLITSKKGILCQIPIS